MRVLVTGAAGFVGLHLTEGLLKAGETVIALVRPSAASSDDSKRRLKKLEALQATSGGKLELVRAEIGSNIKEVIQKIRPEVCAHLAGRSWVRESVGWPEQYVEANLNRTASLLDALRVADCRRIVFASTSIIYGLDAPLPYMEEEIGSAPASPYGATKLGCEILLNSYAAVYGIQAVNLRLFSVYGPELRPDAVPFLIASAIQRNKPFTIFGDGTSMRDYIEVSDAVAAIVSAVRGKQSHAALNIGSGFGTSLLEMIDMIEAGLGKKVERVFKPPVPGELPTIIPDITLSIEKLDWEPKCTIEDGIGRLCKWLNESGANMGR